MQINALCTQSPKINKHEIVSINDHGGSCGDNDDDDN